jgi:prephenate dehydratase
MAKWAMMSDFSLQLPDRPGELARLAAMLREADVNLVGLWGYGGGRGSARFYCVPERADQFRNFARSAGLEFEEGRTFYLTGTDHPGALVRWLEKIASAGINLQAIDAVQVRGEFAGFIWADAGDWDALTELLM